MSNKVEKCWDSAITDAQRMIQEAQAKIRELKKSIAIFQRLRDRGEPFPGKETGQESEAEG
jgi:hypothetical protein